MKLSRISAAVLAATLSLSGCDGDSTGVDDLVRGEFDARVTGDRSASLDGTALSASSVGNAGQDEILLTDVGSGVQILVLHLDDFFSGGSAGLEDGTNPGLNTGIAALIYFGSTDQLFVCTGGMLTVDALESAGITGTLDFDAVEVDQNTFALIGGRVNVQAHFVTRYSATGMASRAVPGAARISAKMPRL